ncbi:MAG: hypothetical protein OSA99_10355, partial [Acidimicrobiales bacterium]|nr:hypothetical protein [Acidimicrobiales bacterium]
LTDRLNEYADLVTKLTRTQASDLEEYRRANERTLADLRRGLATSEETLERVGARIDSMLTDAETSDDSSRRVLAEVRSILEAQENLGRFLTESLDQFGEQVVGRLSASEEAAAQQLEAFQATLADVDATPDPTLGLVDDRLAGIEDRLAVVASNDSAAALGSRFDTLHAAIDELSRTVVEQDDEAVIAHLGKLESELASNGKVSAESWGELAGLRAKVDAILETSANESGAVTGALTQLKETLQDVASGEVVGALWDEVRQVRATVEALVDRDAQTADPAAVESLRSEVTGLTQSVRDLLDQAEVVDEDGLAESDGGHLSALAADMAALREELSHGLVVETPDGFGEPIEALRTDLAALGERLAVVTELRESVAALRDVTEANATAEPAPASLAPEVESELREAVAAVRSLTDSLPVEPVPARLAPEVESELREAVAAVRSLTDSLPVEPVPARLAPEVESELREAVAAVRSLTDSLPSEPPSIELPAELQTELGAVRSGVEDIIGRLDEGLVIADEPVAGASPELTDQIATLRDQVSTEFERIRHLVEGGGESVDLTPLTARLDRLHDDLAEQAAAPTATETPSVDLDPVLTSLEELQAGVAHLLDRPVPAPAPAPSPAADTYAQVDPDVIDLLREEIRNAGGAGDELVETLTGELKALRRRIRLRAEGELFSDQQLEVIAEAVARRLGE